MTGDDFEFPTTEGVSCHLQVSPTSFRSVVCCVDAINLHSVEGLLTVSVESSKLRSDLLSSDHISFACSRFEER
jgi:hypothetical protein